MSWDLLFSFLGSAVGCIGGILASQRLTNFRLEQLEKQVSKHNNLVERMAVAENDIKNQETRLERIERSINDEA